MNRFDSPSAPPIINTRKTSLWRSGLHTLGTSIVSIPLVIVSSIVVARALGPEGKGSFELVLATAALMSVALGFSLPAGVTYAVARGRVNLFALAKQLTSLALLEGAVVAIVLLALRNTTAAPALLPPEMGSWVIVAIVVLFIFTETSSYWRAMLIGREEIIRANQRDFISRMLQLVIILASIGLLTLWGEKVTAGLLIGLSVVTAILKNPLFLETLREPFRKASGDSGLREVLVFALPCYLASLAQFLNYRLDVFFVSFFAGVAAVGLYTLAVTLAQVIWLISNAAATILLPRVAAAHETTTETASQTARVTRLALWASAASALMLALCANYLLTWIYGEAFRGSLAPLLWLLPGIVIFSTANVLASYLAGIGKPRLNLFVSLAGLLVTVSLNLILIPRLNIVGAAISSTVSYTTSAILIIWFFIRESRVPLRQIVLPTLADWLWVKTMARSLLANR